MIFSVGFPMVKPHGSQRTGFLLLGRPSLEAQTPSSYVYGDYNGNVSYKYEGVLKVVRRSRATLLFSVGVLMVKPRGGGGGPGEQVSSC